MSVNLNPKDGPKCFAKPYKLPPSTVHFIQPPLAPSVLQFREFGSHSEQCVGSRPSEHMSPTTDSQGKLSHCSGFPVSSSRMISLGPKCAHVHTHTHTRTHIGKRVFFFYGLRVDRCK